MSYLPTDKIRIFISSRLEECADERTNARNAIVSLNHEPVMFEAAGSRPYPPRSIYLKGIESALFFIGIYKEGYGYIAEGMDISGLEDEYQYAKNIGKPQLLYVRKDCKRDPRLDKLISDFVSPFFTVAFYEHPAELYEKIREDIISLVADYVLRGLRSGAISPPHPSSIVNELVPLNQRIARTFVEEELLKQLESTTMTIVVGPLGAGKTVLLATLASQQEWIFVQCGGRTPREILLEVTNGVRAKLGLDQSAFTQIEEANSALRAGWQALDSIALVLDDVQTDEANLVLAVIEPVGKQRIVLSSRDSRHFPGIATFSLPPLQPNEIRDFVKRNRSQLITPGELEELTRLSEGNPLYLRYYTSVEPGTFERTLSGFELKAWRDISPRAREALSYLALSTRALQLEDLMDLMSSEAGSIEEISMNLFEAHSFLSDTDRGYSIFHSHAKETIRSAIGESPQQLKFYTKRLAKWFSSKHDYTAAFTVLDSNGFEVPPRLLELSGRHAMVQGNVGAALCILQRRLKMALEKEDAREIYDLLVSLANVQSHAGKIDDALQTLEDAQKYQTIEGSFVTVDEVKLSILAWAKGDPSAISALALVKQRYIDEGKRWDAARIALDLSASLIRSADYRKAADEAEFALAAFKVHKDLYGARLAKVNLLSALSAIPEKVEKARDLMTELNKDAELLPRQRAAICNILCRVAREKNDIKGAKVFAQEAIDIGRILGDVAVVCTNLINLGNVFRQEGDLDTALEKYEAADKIARESGLVQSEAWSQELLASIFNRKGDGHRAIQHARYAIGLVRGGISKRTEIEAYEELAVGYETINNTKEACEAWLQAAELELTINKESEFGFWAFLKAIRLFYKEHRRKAYIDAYRRIFGNCIKQSEATSFEFLADEFSSLLACIPIQHAFEATVYHARLTFDELPKVLARQVYLHIMAQMLSYSKVESSDKLKRLRAALALTMSLPKETVLLNDVVEIGERAAQYNSNLSFRAHSDGSAHWAITAKFARPLIVTISQLDDRRDVSIVTLCLALVLLSFSNEISEDVLAGIIPLRNEANIQVVNYHEAKELLPLEKAGLYSMKDTCAVTRATDPKRDAGAPVVVITRDDITSDWLVGEGKGNSGQILFSKVLVELVYHLFAGEIELESLYPKVMSLIKKTVI